MRSDNRRDERVIEEIEGYRAVVVLGVEVKLGSSFVTDCLGLWLWLTWLT